MYQYIHFPEWLSPVIIPGLPFHWYGMMYLLAFTVAYLLTLRQIAERGIVVERDDVANLFFWTIIGLLLGSRIFATTIYDPTGYYLRKPWLIFWPFDEEMNFTGIQGMSYHGGLTGAVVGFIVYCRRRKLSVLEFGDMVVTAVPLGYTFGRLGNFINGELYGRISAAPWAIVFPNAERVPTTHPAVRALAEKIGLDIKDLTFVNLPRHPSQLYEAFLEGVVLWAVMWFVFRKRRPYPGFMIGLYLIGYAIARFLAEYFRQPDAELDFVIELGPAGNPRWLLLSPFNLTTGQVLSLLMAAAGIIVLYVLRRYANRAPKVETYD